MPARVIALFLAFVLLWSGFSTIEAPRRSASPSPEQQYPIAHGGDMAAVLEGSVEHHHLDDLPSQAQSDPPTETPGLPPGHPTPSPPSVVMAQPRAFASAQAGPPFLDGPLRPPCSAPLSG